MAELLPCPFCGGDAGFTPSTKALLLGCRVCKAGFAFQKPLPFRVVGSEVFDDPRTAKQAILLWNNRHHSRMVDIRLVEALRKWEAWVTDSGAPHEDELGPSDPDLQPAEEQLLVACQWLGKALGNSGGPSQVKGV